MSTLFYLLLGILNMVLVIFPSPSTPKVFIVASLVVGVLLLAVSVVEANNAKKS